MEKRKIETFIKKYNLNGILEQAKWVCDKKKLSTAISTADKKLLVLVTLNDFDAFEDSEIGINNTTKLKQMMNVLSDEIQISLTVDSDDKKRIISLVMSDDTIETHFAAADTGVILIPPKLKPISEYNVEIPLTDDFISKFLKAKAALPEVDRFDLMMVKKKLMMVLGYCGSQNNDRISIEVPAVSGKDEIDDLIGFSAKSLKEIISANSECKDAVLKIHEQGLANIEYNQNGFESKYYMVRVPIEE